MAGYLFYDRHRDDILSYSLDAIGDQLVSLIDEGGQEAVADYFARFKKRVLAREVEPERVECIAANVLNLRNSGLPLTPDQARMVLEFSALPPSINETGEAFSVPWMPLPDIPPPPEPVDPEQLSRLGENLQAIIAFNAEIQEAIRDQGQKNLSVKHHVRYHFGKGVQVTLDPALKALIAREKTTSLARGMKDLERMHVVTWKKNLADELARDRKKRNRDQSAILQEEAVKHKAAQTALKNLHSLQALEAMGFEAGIDIDSLEASIERQIAAIRSVDSRG